MSKKQTVNDNAPTFVHFCLGNYRIVQYKGARSRGEGIERSISGTDTAAQVLLAKPCAIFLSVFLRLSANLP